MRPLYSALDPRSFEQKFLVWFKTYEDSVLKFNKDKTLYTAFTNAIVSMVPEWTNVRFSWEADDMLGQLENGEWMPFSMLSSGYKNVVRLCADIAYRAIKLNPHLGKNAVTETSGVVLIDELDMHLHPKWQKTIVADLIRTFPSIQFITTSHSPFIIQSLQPHEIINLEGEILEDPSTKSIEEIAEDEMQIENVKRSTRFMKMQELSAEYFGLIKKGKTSDSDSYTRDLKARLDEIELEFSRDPVYIALMKSERATEMR
jgi:predicted ATP-binding protein involved in virulence